MIKKVAVLGSGGWGTAVAIAALRCGLDVTVWSAFKEEIDNIIASGENPLLKGIKLPKELKFTSSLDCVKDCDMCVVAVPSFAIDEVCAKLVGVIDSSVIIVSISKGFDKVNCERLSQVIERYLPENPIVVLSGPSHAEEVALAIPTALVSASKDEAEAVMVRECLSTDKLRIYSSQDIIGVELGGAIKNVIALCAGICDGMGLGDNTKAALLTRGLREIARLGVAMGARKDTFTGLSGMGDLIVTCTSMHSRNRRAGILIGKGNSISDTISQVGTVEGYHAAGLVNKLAEKYGVSMPICKSCYKICYENGNPNEEIMKLMSRPNIHEDEGVSWWSVASEEE